MRGSGRHIVQEPLTQAERNVIYAIYDFERFKRTFTVDIARGYLAVLQQMDEVDNTSQNYRSLKLRRGESRRLADAGRSARNTGGSGCSKRTQDSQSLDSRYAVA